MKLSEKTKLVLTGGGTAGHVMPHLALLPAMKKRSWELFYIGTNGIEKSLIEKEGLPFYTIKAGKLRRHFSFQNFFDVFKVFWGTFQSLYYLLKIKPDLVFSKGGFVSVPVCFAAALLRIPVVTHESDVTPGLANRLIMKVAGKILYSFPETKNYLPSEAEYVGTPIRQELFQGSQKKAFDFLDFSPEDKRAVLLVMGGSQGALRLNEVLREALPVLLEKYRVIHMTGKGKKTGENIPGSYFQLEYASRELPDLLALADLVISRAGANSLFELKALAKPMILVPLSHGTRGDQVVNARSFEKQGWATYRFEKDLSPELLLKLCQKGLESPASEGSSLAEEQEKKRHESFLDKLASSVRKK